jgi:hypothetical protein
MTSPLAAARGLATAGLLAAVAACAPGGGRYPAMPAPEALPAESPLHSRTLGRTDAWLRHLIMTGQADSAAALLDPARGVAPGDELLRRLQLGVALHHAGRFGESNAAFEWAEAEADARYTRSVSRAVGSLIVNDNVLRYVPTRPEMAMIPAYRMLNYLALGQGDEAVVEARKADAYLQRLGDAKGDPCVGEGMVRYLTGLVHRAAGSAQDALVSFRLAERSFGACEGRDAPPPPELGHDLANAARAAGDLALADSAVGRYGTPPAAPGPGSGELVVFVGDGWVAHRAESALHVGIPEEEMRGWRDRRDDDGDGEADEESTAELAGRISARLVANLSQRAAWGGSWDDDPGLQAALLASDGYVMRLAWAVPRLEANGAGRFRLVAGDSADGAEAVPAVAGDLTAGMLRALEAQRPAMMSRMVARGVAKFVASRKIEEKAEGESRFLGWLASAVTGAASLATERADTRSWSLLPDRVSVARLALPVGEHAVRLEVLSADGAAVRTVDLGRVTIAPGATAIRSAYVWGTEMGDARGRVARAAPADAPSR